MLISTAYAQEGDNTTMIEVPTPDAATAPIAGAQSAVAWNMGLIGILVVMFYLLLIRPQQKRFKEHKEMLDGLNKGDKVVTAGGLVGKLDKIVSDEEVLVDLGGGMKVTAMRSTIQTKVEKDKK